MSRFIFYGDLPCQDVVRSGDKNYLTLNGVNMRICRKLDSIPEDISSKMAAFSEENPDLLVQKGGLKNALNKWYLVGSLEDCQSFTKYNNVALIPFDSKLYLVGIQGIPPARDPQNSKRNLAFYCMKINDPILDQLTETLET